MKLWELMPIDYLVLFEGGKECICINGHNMITSIIEGDLLIYYVIF